MSGQSSIPRKPVPLPTHSQPPDVIPEPPLKYEINEEEQRPKSTKNSRDLRIHVSNALDSILPPQKRYFGASRRLFLIIFVVLLLAISALIIGLSVGLTRSTRSKAKSLPLGSQQYVGDLTYYGPGLGACGETSSDNDMIVSISHIVFDALGKSREAGGDPNSNPLCGHRLRAVREGKSVDLKVVDRCECNVHCQY